MHWKLHMSMPASTCSEFTPHVSGEGGLREGRGECRRVYEGEGGAGGGGGGTKRAGRRSAGSCMQVCLQALGGSSPCRCVVRRVDEGREGMCMRPSGATVNTHYYVKSRVRRLRTSMVLCMSLRSFLTQSLPVLHHPPAPKSPPTPAPLLIHTPTTTSQAGAWLPASTDPPLQPPLHPHPRPVAPPPCPLTPLPLLSHLRSTLGLLPHTSRLARGFRQLRPHTCVESGRLFCRPQLAGVGQSPLD